MAKISKYTYQNPGHIFLSLDVNFDKKRKEFCIELPEEVAEYFNSKSTEWGNGRIWNPDLAKLEFETSKILDEFYNSSVKQEKVILYNLQFISQELNSERKLNFAPQTTIGLEYKVMNLITIAGMQFYSTQPYSPPQRGTIRHGGPRLHSKEGYGDYSNWKEIPHTDELERFFENIEGGLLKLIKMVSEYFGNDTEMLLSNVASRGYKLLN